MPPSALKLSFHNNSALFGTEKKKRKALQYRPTLIFRCGFRPAKMKTQQSALQNLLAIKNKSFKTDPLQTAR